MLKRSIRGVLEAFRSCIGFISEVLRGVLIWIFPRVAQDGIGVV